MFPDEVKKWFARFHLSTPFSLRRQHIAAIAAALFASSEGALAQAQTCPDLRSYYPSSNQASQQEWAIVLSRLENLQSSCLESAEYFALLGAAQLNNGRVANALEALERALLLDPGNGSAKIDYAEGLFLTGQLLSALEVNAALLERQDLPADLSPVLRARQQAWQRMTRQHQYLLEATAGYDTNLNGAPTRSDLTLTLEGTPVTLPLDPEFHPREGEFTNVRVSGYWQSQQPAHSHDLFAAARARLSSKGDTDLGQLDWRYTFSKPVRRHRWELGGGSGHMTFGGSPLYSVADLRARLVKLKPGCQPSVETTLQYLLYHNQSLLNGVEAGVNGGLACASRDGRHQWRVEGGFIDNRAVKGNRPGGDRLGWQVGLNWQWAAGPHEVNAQIRVADLDDDRSYSPLLANGATRDSRNQYAAISYRRALTPGFSMLLNLAHHDQESNLEAFNNRGTVAEAGLRINF